MGEKYLVVGAGKSGIAAIGLLLRTGREAVLYDGNKDLDVKALREAHPDWKDIKIYAGDLPEEAYAGVKVAVLSPGVPTDLPVVDEMRAHNLSIWGEVELAYELGQGTVEGQIGGVERLIIPVTDGGGPCKCHGAGSGALGEGDICVVRRIAIEVGLVVGTIPILERLGGIG